MKRFVHLTMLTASSLTAAQNVPEETPPAEPVSEVVVTGSLLKRAGYEERAPIVAVDAEAIQASGYATVQDLARDLVVNTGSELVVETGDLLGVSQFNIRGLGLGSTLTLINGRRAGIAPVSDGSGSEFFDINQLPLTMIRRVDFLTDGASATYGSQAVAGVANIITRKGFEGFEITADYHNASNENASFGFASGVTGERAQFNLYGAYYAQTRNDRSDFDWMIERIGGGGNPAQSQLVSTTGQPGSYVRANTNATTGTISRASNSTIPDPNCAAGGGILLGTRCQMDFTDQVSIIPEERRTQIFSEMSYDISDRLELYGEVHFADNRVRRTQGPGLFQNGLVNDGSIFIPASHPFNFFIADAAAPARVRYVDPAQWDNSIHTAVDLVCVCRPLGAEFNGEGNADDRRVDLQYWRALGGMKLNFASEWQADVWYQYSEGVRDYRTVFNFVADRINAAALDGSWNPFGSARATPGLVSPKDGVSVAANSDAVTASLSTYEVTQHTSNQWTVDAVVSGSAFTLPAGPVGIAVGAQYRDESFSFTPDPLRAAGEAESRDPIPAASGEQSVSSVFGETIFPIADKLEIQAAVRRESYDEIGGSTVDPKLAFRYEPLRWLAVRGSWGTSFQAPSTRQVSLSSTRQVFDDPASINPATGQLECVDRNLQISGEVRVRGSDDLQPQSADNLNLGVVLQPLSRLRLRADFWTFDYEDLISQDEGAQAILEGDCADGIPNDPRVERDPGGNIRVVNSFFINTGSVKTDGVDLAFDYDQPVGALGDLRFAAQASYINKFAVRATDASPAQDIVGSRNFLNPFRSLPAWRANFSTLWNRGRHQVVATLRYIDSYMNDQNSVEIASFTTGDLQYSIALDGLIGGQSTMVRIGMNNILDKDPPSIGARTRPGYDETVHDVRGRAAYVSLRHEF